MPRLFPVIGGDGTLKVPRSVFLSERSRRRLFSFFKHGNWKPTNLTADDPRDHKCHRLPSVIERLPMDGRTGNLWKAYQSNRRWVWREERGRGQMTSIIRLHPSATRPIHLLTRCSENTNVILCLASNFSLLVGWGNRKWDPSMKVKHFEKVIGKIGSGSCI